MPSSARAPTVSVVISTYNRGALLREAIASVFAQTYADWELIVADDGSTDETQAYLRTLDDPRLRVASITHSGIIGHVRNAAISRARGVWIAFLDSDDLWLPGKLARQIERLDAHPECGWSCTGFAFIDAAGASVGQRSGVRYSAQSGWILPQLLMHQVTATFQTLIVRRELLAELGGCDEALFHDDYDLELRLAAHSELCALPETLALIRQHDGRTTSAQRVDDLVADNLAVFRKARAAATDNRTRAICNHQCAVQLRQLARIASDDGRHGAAILFALRGLATDARATASWRALLRVAGRALGVTRVAAPAPAE